MKSKSILELNSTEAKSFFLKNESYCSIEFPEYINFQNMLSAISQGIGNKKLSAIYLDRNNKPADYEDVNHTLLSNKDGRFSWRPLQLIHPALYVLLVHRITDNNNWVLLLNRFTKISKKISSHIECKSWPRISLTTETNKAAQVSNWWVELEQASLKTSMEFNCIIHTDISDCYGQIYTHSIPWAIHGKKLSKINRKNQNLIGNEIDVILQSMSYGQTNGIPQGSALMDFIAEIILSYIDLNCYINLKNRNIDYKIIRYRDDYRIFTQNEADGLTVLKVLTEVLAGLGMKLNANKTVASNNLIKDSVKPDKWFLLDNTVQHTNLQKQLMFIHKLSGLYPNSGSIKKELLKFYEQLLGSKNIKEDIVVLISIASDIAYRNPATYPVISAILSKLVSYLEDSDKSILFNKIINRFDSIPNTGLVDIWLQRIAIANEILNVTSFQDDLCKIVTNEGLAADNSLLWESAWLQPTLLNILKTTSIIDKNELEKKKLNPIIDINEVSLFNENY